MINIQNSDTFKNLQRETDFPIRQSGRVLGILQPLQVLKIGQIVSKIKGILTFEETFFFVTYKRFQPEINKSINQSISYLLRREHVFSQQMEHFEHVITQRQLIGPFEVRSSQTVFPFQQGKKQWQLPEKLKITKIVLVFDPQFLLRVISLDFTITFYSIHRSIKSLVQ